MPWPWKNAYIKADKLSLAGEVSGVVSEVPVRANQPVKAGDLLVALEQARQTAQFYLRQMQRNENLY